MAYFYLDSEGNRYQPGAPFTLADTQYTSAGATDALFLGLGYTRVEIQAKPDERFYDVGGLQNDGAYSKAERPIDNRTDANGFVVEEGLKPKFIAESKRNTRLRLEGTDWYVVRKYERSIDIPTLIANYRAEVLSVATAWETAVNNCTTFNELLTLPAPQFPAEPAPSFDP